MRKFFIILLIAICGIRGFGQTPTKEEYEIYGLALNEICKDYSKSVKESSEKTKKIAFVILDKTFTVKTSIETKNTEAAELQKVLDELVPPEEMNSFNQILKQLDVNEDFDSMNKSSINLKKLFPINNQYWLASENKIDDLMKIGRKKVEENQRKGISVLRFGEWSKFYKKYPNSNGYFQFSGIGFSPNKDSARVDVNGKGYDWSSYTVFTLIKVKEKWLVRKHWEFYTIS